MSINVHCLYVLMFLCLNAWNGFLILEQISSFKHTKSGSCCYYSSNIGAPILKLQFSLTVKLLARFSYCSIATTTTTKAAISRSLRYIRNLSFPIYSFPALGRTELFMDRLRAKFDYTGLLHSILKFISLLNDYWPVDMNKYTFSLENVVRFLREKQLIIILRSIVDSVLSY